MALRARPRSADLETAYLGMLAQYRADVSNVSAFSMHDFSVTAGPTMRF
jgi:hypothetical protein